MKNVILVILQICLMASMCQVIVAKSDQSQENIAEFEKAIRDFNINLPERYRCCKEGYTLKNINWRVSCIEDHTAKASNISMGCINKIFVNVAHVSSKTWIYFVEDGIVYKGNGNTRSAISTQLYCFGNKTTEPTALLVVLCYENIGKEEVTSELKYKAPPAGVLALVSTPFSALVIFVYASIPQLRDLQGTSIICLCSSYLISSLMVANEDLQILEIRRECHGGGDILYFTLMASVFWMNAITVQTFVSLRFPENKIAWRRQFVWYSCYAWGLPTILFLSTMVADVHAGSLVLPSMELTFNCWEYAKATQWKYYLAPLTATIIASCLLILYSAVLIRRQTSNKASHFEFCLTVKLFLVVGITWLNEPFQILHGRQNIVWIIGDCWNLLQGVLLFLVLVLLRKRSMRAILDKYELCSTPWLRKFTDTLAEDEDASGVIVENEFYNVNTNNVLE